ncbi:methylmalonyl Co-A mutase-associated GTPase MeaB [Heyndrickxia acidicola]|uniref:Methylmalonyl Co-A mutase-associated GTPase MeaB n=1 Tax=Heyndrickxia acidicola TaxID=209389 RepID=A0ABU6MKM5_9BACI|nr:methylmalonyl Co-A mutase-associated GTPase MeaB [Heyndrickxia acidicola]MED1205231.1 methylmalonyl Co-A mutase-associated GTPase MeaB [Heyndrickxia acidicola]
MGDQNRPEWTDPEKEENFTTTYMPGLKSKHDGMEQTNRKRFQKKDNAELDIQEIAAKLVGGNRIALSKAITLIESNAKDHYQKAQELLTYLLPLAVPSIRIGITGVPGAGKSTFIEAFGILLCEMGYKVAVLAVDPSSTVTGGSILGDKTRMENLARHPNAFIRPSPSGGTLGGVHRKTRETVIACEAAGYDVLLIETVGVGQSEVMVRGMVDFFMLLALTGAGDELQGMKKGIMELADAIVINKADGENVTLARKTCREYNQILHFLLPATKGWQTRAFTCSALHGTGLEALWSVIQKFKEKGEESGVFTERRHLQEKEWLYSMIREKLENAFFDHPGVKRILPSLQASVIKGDVPVSKAVDSLFQEFQQNKPEV